jgi:hypothetical protein
MCCLCLIYVQHSKFAFSDSNVVKLALILEWTYDDQNLRKEHYLCFVDRFFRYFNFLASYDFFLNVIFYIFITRLKIKISEKTDQQNTDNVFPLKFNYRSVYSNVKVNFTTFESLNSNLLCCTYVRQRQHSGCDVLLIMKPINRFLNTIRWNVCNIWYQNLNTL